MYILGLSCFYHDAAACLLKDGVVVAAGSEERFSRKKHDSDFPSLAVAYCLEEAGISAEELDAVVFYDKPMLKFERLLRSHIHGFPKSFKHFVENMPRWMGTRLRLPKILKKELGYTGPLMYSEHHLSHAASAYYVSGFESAAVLTVDGVGEWATASWGVGTGNNLEIKGEIRFPHSLGLLYSAFTWYCGFKINSAEYTLMGLAPYGKPRFVDAIRELIHIAEDGSFHLDMRHFSYDKGQRMFNQRFEQVLGRERRMLESPDMEEHYKDVARSIQEITNEAMVKMAQHVLEKTGQTRLCLSGGVALNCVANGHILRETSVEELFIQPAAGDAGSAMGAAYVLWNQLLDKPRQPALPTPYLGPGYDTARIRQDLDRYNASYTELEDSDLYERVAELVDSGKVVGWFQGRMEWGPRALGHRTILGDARHPEMRSIINMKIKMREGFRPFAPTILEEHIGEFFQIDRPSPYMLLVAPVQPDKNLPAITHVDGSARIQSINRQQDERYFDMLSTFYRRTGCPVIINTSMNVRGEPIVNTPEDAYRCFMRTHMDAIAIGNSLLLKEDQPELELRSAKEEFGLD
ncbi:MAG: carbamoyltransferase [Myxococcota bacterium]|nr:carbamoyltransferase [Myxococcota bacterium]